MRDWRVSIRKAIKVAGRTLAGADLNFEAHELSEASYVAQGVTQRVAHWAAIHEAGVSPFAL